MLKFSAFLRTKVAYINNSDGQLNEIPLVKAPLGKIQEKTLVIRLKFKKKIYIFYINNSDGQLNETPS